MVHPEELTAADRAALDAMYRRLAPGMVEACERGYKVLDKRIGNDHALLLCFDPQTYNLRGLKADMQTGAVVADELLPGLGGSEVGPMDVDIHETKGE